MKSVEWRRRERKVRIDLIKDMIRYGFLECKPVSQRRSTGLLPTTIDARREVSEYATQTGPTEHAQ